MCRVRRALSVCGLAAFALPARAQESAATSYALSLVRAVGAEDCAPGRALAADVERRLGRKVFDVSAERSFEVEMTRLGARYHSDVFVRDAGGRALGHRALESDEPGCGALFDATALAIALVIDPEAANRSPSAPGVAAFEPPTASAAPPVVVAAPPPPAAVVPPPVVVESAPRAPALPSTVATLSLRGALAVGVVGAASPGLGLAISALPARSRWGFALSGQYVVPRTAREGAGVFEIGLTRLAAAASFDAARSDDLRLSLSAGPSLGAFHVAVREPTPVTDPGDFLFAALELGAEVQVHVTNSLFLSLGGQGLVPFYRQEFLAAGQDEPVWSQPWLSGDAFLGVGARFP